jgi:hypothetical protein
VRPVWAIACNSRAYPSQSGSFINMTRLEAGAGAPGQASRGRLTDCAAWSRSISIRERMPVNARSRGEAHIANRAAASTEVDVKLTKPTPRSEVLGITARLIISPHYLKHGAEDELSWPRGERTVDHLRIKPSQILANQRLRD